MSHSRLLGFDLCPRLKELKQRHLFLPRGMAIPPEIAAVCEANVNTDLIEKHWDTLVHLAASVMVATPVLWLHWPDSGSAAKGEPVYEAGVQLGRLLANSLSGRLLREGAFPPGTAPECSIGARPSTH